MGATLYWITWRIDSTLHTEKWCQGPSLTMQNTSLIPPPSSLGQEILCDTQAASMCMTIMLAEFVPICPSETSLHV